MDYKRLFYLSSSLLCLTIGLLIGSQSRASIGLQSTGKIVVTNPETNLEEVIFDINDQIKLKDNIDANATSISTLENNLSSLNSKVNGMTCSGDWTFKTASKSANITLSANQAASTSMSFSLPTGAVPVGYYAVCGSNLILLSLRQCTSSSVSVLCYNTNTTDSGRTVTVTAYIIYAIKN